MLTFHRFIIPSWSIVRHFSASKANHHICNNESVPTKAKRKHHGIHLNTLWSIWYGILFTYFQGYLILNGAYRFLGKYSIPFANEFAFLPFNRIRKQKALFWCYEKKNSLFTQMGITNSIKLYLLMNSFSLVSMCICIDKCTAVCWHRFSNGMQNKRMLFNTMA